MLQSPNIYAIFLKSWGFKDVKYDIFPCVNPIQLVPTMQKKGLVRHHFRRKLLEQAHFGSATVSELWPFEVEIPVRAILPCICSFCLIQLTKS